MEKYPFNQMAISKEDLLENSEQTNITTDNNVQEIVDKDLDFFNNSSIKIFNAKYASLDDCTSLLFHIIKNIPVSKADKLIRYSVKLTNFDINEISNLTLEKNRIYRQISTRFVYAFILHKCKDSLTDNINLLFKNVFLRRHKDVDPVIRSISYDFLVDFISLNPKIFDKHKSILVKGLNDKQDLVRKSIVSAMGRKKVLVDKSILVNIAIGDKNKNVKMETCKLLLENDLDTQNMYKILKYNCGKDRFDNKQFNQILRDLIYRLLENDKIETLHNFISNCPDYLDLVEVEYFECDCIESCYLKILEIQKKCIKISNLYDFYKDNINSINSIMGLLIYADIDKTEIFIVFLEDIIKNIKHNNNFILFDKLCDFFKKIENEYKSIIEEIINKVFDNRDYKSIVIKYFDIEDCITDDDYLETQIYKNLWNIINEDYNKMTRLNKNRFDIFNKRDVCNLILYIHSQIKDENTNIFKYKINEDLDNIYDKKSALELLYYDLIEVVNLEDSDLLDFLYKFNEEKILEDKTYLIYKYVDNVEEFSDIFSISKNKINLVNAFFKFLSIFDYTKYLNIKNIAKIISTKFREVESRVIFNNLKLIIGSKDISFLDLFISKLNINECIVLENICKDGLFKNALTKRINKSNTFKSTNENNVTYL